LRESEQLDDAPLACRVLLTSGMTPEELKERTTAFAVEVVKSCRHLRERPEARSTAVQLSDSAQSTASNYRAACRARSHREFVS